MRPERFPPYFVFAMMLFCLIILLLLFDGMEHKKEGNDPSEIRYGNIPHIVFSVGDLTS